MATLRVIEIFDSLQGEGYWTGVPMTFVRLAGCNAPELGLDCTVWCDTPDSWAAEAGEELTTGEVLDRVHLPRLCLTGGEPLLQGIGAVALVRDARSRGIMVHLETNGTLPPPPVSEAEPFFDWVVVSPKPPGYAVASEWEGLVDELKLVVDASLDAATAERLAAGHPEAVVSIQPVWEAVGAADSERSLAAPAGADLGPSAQRAIGLVMEHPGWRLSLQTHKYLGLR